MIKVIDNALTKDQLSDIKEEVFTWLEYNRSQDMDNGIEGNTFGYPMIRPNKYAKYMDDIIKKEYPSKKYMFTHSFTRVYFNNSGLKIHLDRKHLDLTASVNITSNLDEDWPLYFSNISIDWERYMSKDEEALDHDLFESEYDIYLKDCTPYYTKPGQAILGEARLYPHWRHPLQCRKDQYYVQTFYHWMEIK